MLDPRPINRDRAEWIAIAVLGSIAKDPSRLERFLTVTGIAPRAVRVLADDERFLAGVVDYVAEDPALVAIILSELSLHPADLSMAQYALRKPKREEPSSNVVRLPIPPRRVK
ncbi:hypothetical protein J2X65_003185 [Ancylobacter sp. 3268]|uniref:DUF3572 family protein n=1 Tax=Ancylobacter sp. 3268 TaxID=2817752 RepID=UPI00285706A5|nr:DUF3572 family protein [Ancylobacter sp. 3268]MDR6953822.1 hypothetical protein [Ancylobacter sp. 3268]